MDIPSKLVEDGFEHIDSDEANAGFDQLTGVKTALAEAVEAVFLAEFLGFFL